MEKIKFPVKILIILGLCLISWELHLETFFYWIVLISWLISTLIFKIPSAKSLFLGLALYILAGLLKLIGSLDISEYMFRLSLLIILLAIGQSLYKLRYDEP